jgi:Polyketide cyclase / dehydrase and lipid transport
MFSTLMTVLIVLLVIVLIVLALASRKPDSFRVERRVTINAAPETAFAFVNDFHRWSAWSPWEKLDPKLTREYSGSESGTGAIYAWRGNAKVGEGRMEIMESVPFSRLRIKLDFMRPFKANNTTEFTFASQGNGTNVVWAMHGPAPLASRIMQVFMSMDAMVGKDFERGLASMKMAAEERG